MTLSDPTTREVLAALSAVDRSPGGLSRRRFLGGALALGATGVGTAMFPGIAAAGPPLGANDRILVTLLMAGGNDGAGMIAPLNDGLFRSTRGALAGDPATAHQLDQGYYLDENLVTVKSLYDQGSVACVLGVGNPLDDHSHFTSMATWMAGTQGPLPSSGWLGRYGQAASFDELGMLSVGDGGIPLHLRTPGFAATAVSPTGRMFGVSENDLDKSQYDVVQANASVASGSQWLDAVASTFSQSIDTARTLNPAYAVESSSDGLVLDMEVAAKMINLDIGARVLGVTIGGFDHHDGQAYPQGQLMMEVDAAIAAFYATLDPAFADRVAIMTFSEFGRSFTVNGSSGTDHGTASNLMVIGQNVKGGIYGQYPSLTDLDSIGDFKHTVDYRSYYASVLDGWLGADSSSILSGSFEDLGLFDNGGQTPVGSGTATVIGSCLAFDGRFDITLMNAGAPGEFEVRVGALPPRFRSLAAGQSVTVTVTGRREGSIPIVVLRNGVQIHSSVETVACDPAEPEVQIDQSCLQENGRIDVRFNNDSSSAVTYGVLLEGLPERTVNVLANAKSKLTITGRRDKTYSIEVRRNGAPIANQDIVVSCDPPGPGGNTPVSVATSCLGGRGRVDVYLHNETGSGQTYDVTIGRVGPRTRTIPPKGDATVTVTGRRNGPIEITVLRGGEPFFSSTETIDC